MSKQLNIKLLRIFITLIILSVCLFLTACNNRSIGIIGGADGPTSIIASEKRASYDIEKHFRENYVNERKLPILDIHIENPFVSDDRTLILDDTIENYLELIIYEYYYSKTSGDYSKIKNMIAANDALTIAINNEEKQFNDGIYYNEIILDEIDIIDKEDAQEISRENKQKIIDKLSKLGMLEFAIIEVEKTVKLNEKYISTGPQISDGDITRYYLLGKKDDMYKIIEVYWEGFIN